VALIIGKILQSRTFASYSHLFPELVEDVNDILSEEKDILFVYNRLKKTISFYPALSRVFKINVTLRLASPIALTTVMKKVREHISRIILSEGKCLANQSCVWEALAFTKDVLSSADALQEAILSLPSVQNVEIKNLNVE